MRKPYRNIPLPMPFNLLRRLSGVNPLIVNYHVVSDKKLPHVENLYGYRNSKTFNEDLDFLCKKYRPISMHEFLENIKGNKPIPDNSLLITFDDGFREIYELVAPILLDRKITTTVFLTSNFIDNKELNHDNKKSLIIDHLKRHDISTVRNRLAEILDLKETKREVIVQQILGIPYKQRFLIDELAREICLDFRNFLLETKPYMNSAQINELIRAGFTFGSHSIDHARYAELSLAEQIHQTLKSTELVCKQFNLSYRVFAFPYNDTGVNRNFFNSVETKIDASFGTRGLLKDTAIRNFQRISVEKFNVDACRTITFHYKRKILYHLLKKDTIKR